MKADKKEEIIRERVIIFSLCLCLIFLPILIFANIFLNQDIYELTGQINTLTSHLEDLESYIGSYTEECYESTTIIHETYKTNGKWSGDNVTFITLTWDERYYNYSYLLNIYNFDGEENFTLIKKDNETVCTKTILVKKHE